MADKKSVETTVTITVQETGDVYEAVKVGNGPWDISYPEGGDRFYGSEGEVRAHIRQLIKKGTAAKIAG